KRDVTVWGRRSLKRPNPSGLKPFTHWVWSCCASTVLRSDSHRSLRFLIRLTRCFSRTLSARVGPRPLPESVRPDRVLARYPTSHLPREGRECRPGPVRGAGRSDAGVAGAESQRAVGIILGRFTSSYGLIPSPTIDGTRQNYRKAVLW